MTQRPIRVNRAPVLTLWAAVVAGRLGHPPATAFSLASAVAGTAARAKARRLGLAETRVEEPRPGPATPGQATPAQALRLLGREVAVTEEAGTLLAADAAGRPARPAAVEAYVARAFGPHLAEVRAAMEALAAGFAPEELNRIGFRLYEAFRPEVAEGVEGWGAKADLHLDRIRSAAG
ncbi:hypothetical protein [Paracraurococcus ruber]|uniref:Uncharacterized protein n=1 Tax=Paracraurococcus ruber TaxID=77675 RepID=A0ABS1D193_9PROT|nr:hypothetical protein [Paracraurococcus ruber]MBK1660585.1 hypothetical protein [Paracraurococcus ruber]TDG27439.1 hypothetical protein E2C05_22880 [Paracraurococcus ruber]